MNVLNSARTGSPTGPVNDINGTVVQTNPDNAPGELLVQFPSAPQSKNANCKLHTILTVIQIALILTVTFSIKILCSLWTLMLVIQSKGETLQIL